MKSNAATVDAYLAELPEDRRAALTELRALIQELAPDAEEGMAYGMASYALGGPLFGLQANGGGRYVVFGGGIPIEAGGEIVGGLGVSGSTVENDVACAQHAVRLFADLVH